MRRDANEGLGDGNMPNVCTTTPPQSGEGAVHLPHNVGLQYGGHWSVWRGCEVSDTKGDNATFAFQGTIHTTPSYTSHLTRMITGISLEVYGAQMVEKAQANEGSTYILDGGKPSINANVPTTTPSSDVVLFSTSGLANSSHTLTIFNGGVTLGLDFFITQTATPSSKSQTPTADPGSPSGGPTPPVNGKTTSSTSTRPLSRPVILLQTISDPFTNPYSQPNKSKLRSVLYRRNNDTGHTCNSNVN